MKQRSSGSWWWIGLLLLLILAFAARHSIRSLYVYLSYRMTPDYPKNTDQRHRIPGLSQPAHIRWDRHGIAHIEAANDLDLARTVGFVHGRDRFFQMDMLRRVARGRISEVVGARPFLNSNTVAFDRAMRGWGFERLAEAGLRSLSAEEKALVSAYVEGVNAALERFRPWEYRLLGLTPQPWKASDTFALGMLNTWSISHNWQQELVRFLLALEGGIQRSGKIYPHTPLREGVSLSGEKPVRQLQPAVAPELFALFPLRTTPSPAGQKMGVPKKSSWVSPVGEAFRLAADTALLGAASNAWVVDGRHSYSGKPLLANDPHLSHFLPSLLFQQHLRTPTLNVIGVTFPGVPFVLIGHNHQVAWGMTAAVADAMDLVIEKPDPKHPDRVQHDRKVCHLFHDTVNIAVRDKRQLTTQSFVLRRTCHGPMLNDMYPHLFPPGSPWVTVRWHMQGFAKQIGIFQKANRARTVAELKGYLSQLTAPVSTVQAADTQGNIGIFWAGTVPLRTHHRGTFPVPGWLDRYEWKGFVPHHEIPSGMNPSQGFFAHGNNLLVDPNRHTHTLQIDSAPPYRVQRISELLRITPKHTLESFAKIQHDVKILRAKAIMPYLLADLKAIASPTDTEKQAIQLLSQWDFMAHKSSAATAIFFSTYRNAVLTAIRDEVSKAGVSFFMSQRYSTNVSDGWFLNKDHEVWDDRATAAREQRTEVVQQAFRDAIQSLRQTQGTAPQHWRWGHLHRLHFRHMFGGQKLLASVVNLPEREAAGSLESVWKSHHDLGHTQFPFRTVAGPSLRMLVDLADFSKSRWIIETGASGWPLSPHYGDQFEQWYQEQYIPMLSDKQQITPQIQGTWILSAQ